ncbi:MAG: SsrA-binding protein SmpB [Gammaproteobacteria bacterium]|jgi:SsrA-binding protein
MNKQTTYKIIAQNKKAGHDYFFEERLEAGIELLGWEVKSLRAGKGQLTDSYVLLKNGEAWLLGAHIQPLGNVPEYLHPDPIRSRRLLLKHKELNKLIGAVERQGYTVVATHMYWDRHLVKVGIALAKGKKQFDKRQTLKERDFARDKARGFKEQKS